MVRLLYYDPATGTVKTIDSSTLGAGPITLKVAKGGVLVGDRGEVNFIESTGVTLTLTDDPTNDKVDVAIAAASKPLFANFKLSTPISVNDSSYTNPSWDYVESNEMSDAVALDGGDNTRINFLKSGRYLVLFTVAFAHHADTALRFLHLDDDDTTFDWQGVFNNPSAGSPTANEDVFTLSGMFLITNGAFSSPDRLRAQVYQTSGGAITLNWARIVIIRLGDA